MGLLDNMQPAPRNRMMGLLADALTSANQFATQMDPRYANKRQNQTLGLLADAVSLGSLAKTADRASYGESLTNAGRANVPFLKPETADAMMMATLSPRTALGAVGLAGGVDQSANKAMLLYHGSNSTVPLRKIESGGGPFGGLFAGDAGTAAAHGKFVYRMTVPDEQIMGHGGDAGEAALNVVRKSIGSKVNEGDLKAVANLVASDIDDIPEHLVGLLSKSNPYGEMGAARGDAAWYLQRLRGEVAQNLGFKAAAMRDEHGISFLVKNATPRPYNDEARLLARGTYKMPESQPMKQFTPPQNTISLEEWRRLPENEKASKAAYVAGNLGRREAQEIAMYRNGAPLGK